MTSPALGLAMALGASVALSASYLLQHAGSASAAAVSIHRPWATLRSLLRSPRWVVGAAVGLGGWALHVGALSRAPLSLVQAFVAGGLALTVPLAALLLGHRAGRAEQRATFVMVGALILLAAGLHGDGGGAPPPTGPLAAYLLVLAVLTGIPLVAARRKPSAETLALAGGAAYGAADLVIKGLTGIGRAHGAEAVLTSPWLVVAAALSVAAFFSFQRALQVGRPVAVIALMTAATNVASIAGGFVVLGDVLGRTPGLALVHALGFLLVGVAAWRLAPSQAAVAGEVR